MRLTAGRFVNDRVTRGRFGASFIGGEDMKLESLEELRVFTQIVESGSIAEAARTLGMPATMVSRRLAALEERLGTPLLYRSTRSQSLSEAGRTLLERASRILDEAVAAEEALDGDAAELSGVVRVGVPSILTADLFAAVRTVMLEHPALELEVSVHDRLVSPVAEGLDVAIMGGSLADSTLVVRKLVDVELIVVAATSYLEAFGRPTRPEDLTSHRTVHFRGERPITTWTLTDADGVEYTIPVSGRVRVDDARAVIEAVVAGLGLGLTSRRVLRAHPELEHVLPDLTGFRFPAFAIFPRAGPRSARVEAIVSALAAVLHDAR